VGSRAVLDAVVKRKIPRFLYYGESRSFRTGRLERELQIIQLSAIRYSCIAILWVSLLSLYSR
jgi:hypothetical protein